MSYFMTGNQKDGRVGPQFVTNVASTLLSVAEPMFLRSVLLANTSGVTPVTVGVGIVPSGGVDSDAYAIVPNVNVPPSDMLTFEFGSDGIPLVFGDAIRMLASVTNLVTIVGVFSRRNR